MVEKFILTSVSQQATPACEDKLLQAAQCECHHPTLAFAVPGRELQRFPYLGDYVYFEDLGMLRLGSEAVTIRFQYEAGVTMGLRGAAKLWIFECPRVGFGYRFGGGLSVYRLVLEMPF